MTVYRAIAEDTIALVWIILCVFFFHRRGYRRGYQRGLGEGHLTGYRRGSQNADSWWLGTERDVDQTRQEIWKERQ